ncbi:MAG: hypothetical protein L0Y54_05480 [Sporichthyaceae bacterium]|nr:hypothetical protein [Sporichthyaceae bacterium]
MALICVAADKGSPGVTTTALCLGAAWPRAAVVAELDPAGGDLLYRTVGEDGGPLDPELGLLSLVAAARHRIPPGEVLAHCHRLHGGLPVLAGIQAPSQANALAGSWPRLGELLAQVPGTDVLADCGRLDAGAYDTTMGVLPHAAVLLLVARVEVDQVAHLRDRIAELARGDRPVPPIAVVLIAEDRQQQRNAAAEVTRLLRGWDLPAAVVGVLPVDPLAAAYLSGRLRGNAAGSALDRAAVGLADRIVDGFLLRPQATERPPRRAAVMTG